MIAEFCRVVAASLRSNSLVAPIAAVLLAGLVAPSVAMAQEVQWLAPVDAPVVDGFRPPSSRYSAGNRGLEFGLVDETDIRAVDDGRVTFAGRVGSDLHLTIDHGGGLVSTLAFLESVHVVRGQTVSLGDVVARAGPGFHLTARLDGVYIDPALLIAGVEIAVALVGGLAPAGGAKRVAVGEAVAGIGRGQFDSVLALAHSTESLRPSSLVLRTAQAAAVWHHQDCTAVDGGRAIDAHGRPFDLRPADNGDRVLIQVGGLGSSSDEASIGKLDPLALGYQTADVKGFSYAGGCIERPFGFQDPGMHLAGHEPQEYGPEDTYQSVEISAARLAALIEETAKARPDAVIDVAAHSLGGVVTRRAVELLHARGSSDRLGVVMTIGSPHAGANLATIASAAHGGLDAANQFLPVGDFRDADSVVQLSEVGQHSLARAPDPPDGVSVIAVAGSTDPVVPAPAAIWDGAANVLVNLDNPTRAHSDLPGTRAVHDALALGIAGAAPACVDLGSVLAGSTAGTAISAAERGAAIAAGAARWLL